ncbi:hypothetical protein DKM19_17735 [Streptosporangium sp. 'caverna']|nr:hypothetical protein DKM19_17735 [Streptosporangium sp. 'caverna']
MNLMNRSVICAAIAAVAIGGAVTPATAANPEPAAATPEPAAANPGSAVASPGPLVASPEPAVFPDPLSAVATIKDWGATFDGEIKLTNTGEEDINEWTVMFALSEGVTITNMWGDGKRDVNGGTVTVTPVGDWARTIAKGASRTASFTGIGKIERLLSCTANGMPCTGDVGAGEEVRPPAPPQPGETWVSNPNLKITQNAQEPSDYYQVVYTAKNEGTNALRDWGFAVGPEEGTVADDAWGDGELVNKDAQVDDGYALMTNPAWDKDFAPGATKTVTVGYKVTSTGKPIPARPGIDARTFAMPFVDAAGGPTPNLADISTKTGIKQFNLGFITAAKGTDCRGAWTGTEALDARGNHLVPQINKLRDEGGDVVLSFGGENGKELAQVCEEDALATEYREILDRYKATKVDFDIEGGAQRDRPSLGRRARAIKEIQDEYTAAGKHLSVSLTLPVLPTGLTADGLGVLHAMKNAAVRLDVVNIMAMMFGEAAADSTRYGDYVIQGANGLHAQLEAEYPRKSAAALWRMIGVTPNLGNNADQKDSMGRKAFFTPAHANQVAEFARSNGIGMLSMWSTGRDVSCPGSADTFGPNCSGVTQEPWDFSKIFATYTGRWEPGMK